ncbi:glycosyltransferase family 9 protein [Vibrio mangrovi]|uniref:Glycosyltransferase family 9 protein n=1 Tax=Vibrio mangrovi TaxID=474394 RepID=A0A1Y6J3L6_9VIBR|nr:glycosyltransferase family 9 protein [Vibrio mangrovi]MDW6005258.1 glycosyltransferase family 9 protein [Vibrio mangrovi]SMS02883.1 lipopolysaccharide core biosynthesis protein [Vibrio mangrovi]
MSRLPAYTKLHLKNALRRFDRARKKRMSVFLNGFLGMIKNRTMLDDALLPTNRVHRIVIVRNNSRVGNTVFLIPFIRQVRQTFPHAHITLVLKSPQQRDIFAHIGVGKFVFSQFSFSRLRQCFSTLSVLRKSSFDLCLMPFGSAQDSIICALIRAKNKVAFTNQHYSQAFTHTFPEQSTHSHMALKCLSLLPQMIQTPAHKIRHQMSFSHLELSEGQSERRMICPDEGRCIAFFRGARGNKWLSDEAWLAILDKFEHSSEEKITWVEIMGPEIEAPLKSGAHIYKNASLRELACFLKYTDAFISCDTGPLHLADAADAKCIGLYTHTNPEEYGLLGERCVHIRDITAFDAAKVLRRLFHSPSDSLVKPYRFIPSQVRPLQGNIRITTNALSG